MSEFLMAVDAGGTKTLGVIKARDSEESWHASSAAGSLTNDLSSACENIKQVVESLIDQAGCKAAQINFVCGAAGAGNDSSRLALSETLHLGFNKILITTDARASLYGAAAGEAVVVVALGTGSVAMRLDQDGVEKQFGGWGFAAGDLGGGAYMGQELISAALSYFDQENSKHNELFELVFSQIGRNKKNILDWLKNSSASQFAQFAPMLFKYSESEAAAKLIIKKTVVHVERLISLARSDSELPLVLLGGISAAIFPYLDKETKSIIIPAKGDALSGSLYLAERL